MCTYGVVHLTECRIRSFSSFLFCFLSEICLCKNPIATYPFPFLLVQWGWSKLCRMQWKFCVFFILSSFQLVQNYNREEPDSSSVPSHQLSANSHPACKGMCKWEPRWLSGFSSWPSSCPALLTAGVHTGLVQPRALLSGHFIAEGGIATLEADNLSLLWRPLWPWG